MLSNIYLLNVSWLAQKLKPRAPLEDTDAVDWLFNFLACSEPDDPTNVTLCKYTSSDLTSPDGLMMQTIIHVAAMYKTK